jgi:dTDP-4-amino-4,6-dideoxygalactose transaminase
MAERDGIERSTTGHAVTGRPMLDGVVNTRPITPCLQPKNEQPPALLGGRPLCDLGLRLTEPTLPPLDLLAPDLAGMWERRWLTNDGPLCRRFGEALRVRLGVAAVVPTASGTAGLIAVLRGLGIGGEVIVPSFTFSATAMAVAAAGAVPIFADVDPGTWALTAETAASQIGPRTEAILAVHVFGWPCDPVPLERLALAHGLALVFDAAHAFGCRYPDGTAVGTGGDAEVFSFHATKLLAVGEGGAIATRDADLARRFAAATHFGDGADSLPGLIGTNGKLQEWNAVLGWHGLRRVDAWIARRAAMVRRYRQELRDLPGLNFQIGPAGSRPNHQYLPVAVDAAAFGLSADELVCVLRAEGLEARRYFAPALHRHPAFVSLSPSVLPVADRLASQALCLPLYSHLEATAVDLVCHALRRAHRWRRELRSATTSVR